MNQKHKVYEWCNLPHIYRFDGKKHLPMPPYVHLPGSHALQPRTAVPSLQAYPAIPFQAGSYNIHTIAHGLLSNHRDFLFVVFRQSVRGSRGGSRVCRVGVRSF